MRIRGEKTKGKRTKDKPKCKIYIFCEGKTEKLYLQHFGNRTYNVEVISVNPKHTNAYGIVLFAENYIKKEKMDLKLGDRGYCVFDSDPKSNPDIKKVFELLEHCKQKGVYSIFSNPSFEVWFALHFGDAPYGKNAVQMKRHVGELLKKQYPEYSETTDIYDFIFPMQKDAVKRAKLLHKRHQEVYKTVYCHDCNPYTDMFQFIEYMEEIKGKSQ